MQINIGLQMTELTIISGTIRIFLSIIIGIIIGWERGRKGRSAGIKTHALVCMASALVMMTGQFIFNQYGGTNDITRLGAQVISGVGFLGAGTIILTGNSKVKGLTTAASIWSSACIGLAVGIGYISGALIALFAMLFVFIFVSRFESYISNKSKFLDLYFETCEVHCIGEVIEFLKEKGCKIIDVQVTRDEKGYKKKKECNVAVLINIYLRKAKEKNEIIFEIQSNPSIKMVEEV